MSTNTTSSPNGKANTIKETFRRKTSVSIRIKADPTIIWKLLTQAADYPRWNSTIISIEGSIERWKEIRLKSTLDPKRTFTLMVQDFDPPNKLVWGDNKGWREFTLTPEVNGMIRFSMIEQIGGLMFPLYAKYIPSFDQSFEQFAADLKKESESINNTNE